MSNKRKKRPSTTPPEESLPHTAENIVKVLAEQRFSGPLPHPEVLQNYENVLPGLAERIVAMAEAEQKSRHTEETEALRGQLKYASRGQWFGFGISMAGLVVSGVVIFAGYPWGAVISLTALTNLAGIFVGRHRPGSDPD
ncbi:MAG: DUF2335 domain-containing protein [Candidatus Nitrospinota bacterium M3_3B_026]